MDTTAVCDAIGGLLADTPDLHGAACVGVHGWFDEAASGDAESQRLAREVCTACPVLARCAEWTATLKAGERIKLGVLAGVSYTPVKVNKPTGWQPGVSGNPAGRPRRDSRGSAQRTDTKRASAAGTARRKQSTAQRRRKRDRDYLTPAELRELHRLRAARQEAV